MGPTWTYGHMCMYMSTCIYIQTYIDVDIKNCVYVEIDRNVDR